MQTGAARQVWPYSVKRGQTGPLAFVWAVGLALLVFFDFHWLNLFVWSAAILALFCGMIYSYLRNRDVREQLLRYALDRQCKSHGAWEPALWRSDPMGQGIDVLVKTAMLVDEIEKKRGYDSDLRHAFAHACGLFWLKYSLARDAGILEGGLGLAGPGPELHPLADGESAVTMPADPLQPGRAVGGELAPTAQSSENEVQDQLEALLPALRSLREKGSRSYQIAVAELSAETADVLERLRVRAS